MKRYVTLFLALVLALTAFPGALAESESTKFTVMANVTSDFGDLQTQWLMEKIKEKFNIEIEVTAVSSEGFEEKKNLAFGSNQLPDFFFGSTITPNELAAYGDMGVIIPLEGYFTEEYMPNFTAKIAEYPEAYNAMFFLDGHAYALCSFKDDRGPMGHFWLNTAWAEQYIGKVPETLDEYYDYLVAIRDNDVNGNGDATDEYGFYGQYNSLYGGYYDGQLGILTAFGFVDRMIQVNDGKVVLVPVQENYKEYLKFMNKLYTEGLMNPDYFTTSEEERIAVQASELCASFSDWAQWLYMTEYDTWSQWQAIDPLTSEFNSEKMWPGTDINLAYTMCITNKCQNVEKLLELADWFYTDEGALSDGAGPMLGEWAEHPDWGWEFKRDETGYGTFIYHYPEENYDSLNAWMHDVISPWAWPSAPLSDFYANTETRYDITKPEENLTYNTVTHREPFYRVSFPSTARLLPEESDELGLITTDLKSHIDQYITKFIIGELDIEENFAAYVEETMAIGGARFEEVYQTVYDRWANN